MPKLSELRAATPRRIRLSELQTQDAPQRIKLSQLTGTAQFGEQAKVAGRSFLGEVGQSIKNLSDIRELPQTLLTEPIQKTLGFGQTIERPETPLPFNPDSEESQRLREKFPMATAVGELLGLTPEFIFARKAAFPLRGSKAVQRLLKAKGGKAAVGRAGLRVSLGFGEGAAAPILKGRPEEALGTGASFGAFAPLQAIPGRGLRALVGAGAGGVVGGLQGGPQGAVGGATAGFLAGLLPKFDIAAGEVRMATGEIVSATSAAGRRAKLIAALESAVPARKETKALFKAERARRFGKLAEVRGRESGEAGLFAELGVLKGELPRAELESIRKNFTQADVNGLMNDINNIPGLSTIEGTDIKFALIKMLEGKIPTEGQLKKLKLAFGDEMLDALRKNRPLLEKIKEGGLEIANMPRAIMSSTDLSAPLRQGIFLIGRPKIWMPAFASMMKQSISTKHFVEVQNGILSRPTAPLMRRARLALTEMGRDLTKREEAFYSSLAEKIPALGAVIRFSNRGYVGFLNKLRADTFDDMIRQAKKLGRNPETDERLLRGIGHYINAATGRGSLPTGIEKSAGILNAAFFSPRLIASRLQLMNPHLYIASDPFVRQQAWRDMLSFVGIGSSFLGLLTLGREFGVPGLKDTEIGTDLRSSDFGKVKVGNTRYDIWGGFQQFLTAATRLTTGESTSAVTGRTVTLGEGFKTPTRGDIALRFLKSKQAPFLSLITTMIDGKTFAGQPASFSTEVVDRLIPMALQDFHDAILEEGVYNGFSPQSVGRGALKATPALFGVGVQTFGTRLAEERELPSGRRTVGFRGLPTAGENIPRLLGGVINRQIGAPVTPLSTIPRRFQPLFRETKQRQVDREIAIDLAKKQVKATGQTVYIGETKVFMENGIVKVRTLGANVTPDKLFKYLFGE